MPPGPPPNKPLPPLPAPKPKHLKTGSDELRRRALLLWARLSQERREQQRDERLLNEMLAATYLDAT